MPGHVDMEVIATVDAVAMQILAPVAVAPADGAVTVTLADEARPLSLAAGDTLAFFVGIDGSIISDWLNLNVTITLPLNADLNGNALVNAADLAILLARGRWRKGTTPRARGIGERHMH